MRAREIGLWVLQVAMAGWFLTTGVGKLTGEPISTATFAAIGAGDWLRHVVGVLEIAGGIGLLVPFLCGLAAAAFVLLLVGAVATQAFVIGDGVLVPLVALVPILAIAWGRWDRTTAARRRALRTTGLNMSPYMEGPPPAEHPHSDTAGRSARQRRGSPP